METKEKDLLAEHLRGLSGYNEKGEEIPDPRPVALPVGFERPRSLQETMRYLLRQEEFRRAAAKHELESFEEADDFDIEDDDDGSVLANMAKNSPYESHHDPDGVVAREQEIRSGFVEEIPAERKEKARKVIEEHRRKTEESKHPPKKKAKPEKEEEDGDGEEE